MKKNKPIMDTSTYHRGNGKLLNDLLVKLNNSNLKEERCNSVITKQKRLDFKDPS